MKERDFTFIEGIITYTARVSRNEGTDEFVASFSHGGDNFLITFRKNGDEWLETNDCAFFEHSTLQHLGKMISEQWSLKE